jgi:cytochrome c oxidase cbb3-type subunit 1
VVWVSYAWSSSAPSSSAQVPHIYVANWFYGGFILTVALLHLVNSARSR